MKKNILKICVSILLFLIPLNIINRELYILGKFDIRLIILPLSIVVLFLEHKKLKKKIHQIRMDVSDKVDTIKLLSYFILVIVVTIFSILTKDVNINLKLSINLLILTTYNIILLLLFVLYREEIDLKKLSKSVTFAMTILLLSIFFVVIYKGDGILGYWSSVRGFVQGPRLTNFLGKNFRAAGYAEDANYASLILIIIPTFLLWINKKSITAKVIFILSAVAYIFTASLTLALGTIMSLIICAISWRLSKIKSLKFKMHLYIFKYIGTFVLMSTPIILLIVSKSLNLNFISTFGTSMGQRLQMWDRALDLFYLSPVFGSGLGSARIYFLNSGARAVQMHNTSVQVLSEVGILGFLIITTYFSRRVAKLEGYSLFVILLFLFFSLTQEALTLVYFSMVIIISYICETDNCNNEKIRIFFVNSLKGGGAEKAINNRISQSSNVSVVLSKTERQSSEDNIFLNTDGIFNVIKSVVKLNSIVSVVGGANILESSSHLFRSHIISNMTLLRKRTIYTMHSTAHSFRSDKRWLFVYQILYYKKRIVVLSPEIGEQFASKFKIPPTMIKTFNNSLDFLTIDQLVAKTSNVDQLLLSKHNQKFLLFCGRLESVKDIDFLLRLYSDERIHNEYDLVILGEGTESKKINEFANLYEFNEKIHILGFDTNPYTYFNKASFTLLTSHYEAAPMVILECLYSDGRIISYDCDFGPRNMLTDEHKKYLVKNKNIEEWVKIILDNEVYPVFERNKFEEYTEENVAFRFSNLYRKWEEVV